MLRLFGLARMSGAATQSPPPTVFVVAAVLDLTAGRRLSRSALSGRIWEGATANAGVNLRQFLRRLRVWEEANGVQIVQSDERMVWRDNSTIASDLSAFLAMQAVRTEDDLINLNEWYGGDLLADLPPMAQETAEWIGEERERLRERFVRMALEGAQRVGGSAGLDMLQRLSAEAPYEDAVARARMAAASRTQGGKAVRAIYDGFAQRLRNDLGGEPEPLTEALLRELLPPAVALPAQGTVELPAPIRASINSIPKLLILPPSQAGNTVGPEDEALGFSLIDEVTFSLGQARTFAVFAPHTARQLATSPFPGGNPYGVDYILNSWLNPGHGTGKQLKVTLTDVATHELLMSEMLDFSPDSLLADHRQLVLALEAKLSGSIARSELAHYRSTGSASAYVHYLIAAEALKTFDLKPVRHARAHLKHAISLSPGFALARAALARSACLEWVLLMRPDLDPIKMALETAERAVADDPLNPIVHREVGNTLVYLDRLDEAVSLLETAVSLGPHHADILFNYADGLTHIGRNEDARAAIDKAFALNPLPPDLYYWISAMIDYALNRYPSASVALRKMKQPESAARVIAAVEAMNGNLEEARRQRDIYMARHPMFRLADYKMPQRSREDREHYLAGLRLAGFT